MVIKVVPVPVLVPEPVPVPVLVPVPIPTLLSTPRCFNVFDLFLFPGYRGV